VLLVRLWRSNGSNLLNLSLLLVYRLQMSWCDQNGSKLFSFTQSTLLLMSIEQFTILQILYWIQLYSMTPRTTFVVFTSAINTHHCALTEHHAMKVYWRIGGIAPRIL
jgi:hypothetical protein